MKKNDKLQEYFNAAKNNGTKFTQNELQRIVETVSDEKERGLNFINTKNWKGILFIITLALTLLTSTLGILIGIGNYPNSSSHSKKIQTNINSESKSIKKTEPTVPITMQSSLTQQNFTKEPMKSNIVQEKVKPLNIVGITTISLKKDELTKLGITTNKDCGVTISANGIAITYHILNNNNKLNYYDVNHIKTPVDSMLETRNKSLGLDKDSNGIFTSVSSIDLSTKTSVKIAFPLLVTGADGRILSDRLGSQINEKDTSLAQRDADWLDSHNPEHKPTRIFYLEPQDSSMTDEQIKLAMGDTSNTLVIFRRLTAEQSEEIKKAQIKRNNEINEYIKLDILIAIKVETDCKNNEIIFWYDFSDLKKELPNYFIESAIYDITQRKDTVFYTFENSPVLPIEKPKTGCEYSDICRIAFGAVIESSVFPNPANESISLKFTLKEQRKCTFSIHDLNGTYIRELSEEMTFTKGEHISTMGIHDIRSGVYLLSMITDRNERIVQRVIVKK